MPGNTRKYANLVRDGVCQNRLVKFNAAQLLARHAEKASS